jgi:Type II secretory pathway, component ExeA (predicted ATPase)
MFLNYFNLAEEPFGATPDPRFLLPTHSHREALASLQCGFLTNRGFTVLIAEPGMGKTTLLNAFLHQIEGRARTVFLFNSITDPRDVVKSILSDLGIIPAASEVERNRQLNEILYAEASAGRRLVVIIDEAQNLSTRVLEAVRQLTNFETASSKLMQVILAGQPQLGEKLASPQLTQLRQRVSTLCHLARLNDADVIAYIDHRLKTSGWSGGKLFTNSAVRLIAEASGGIPRNINTLCFNALCLCRARSAKIVEREMVAEVVQDLQLSESAATLPQQNQSHSTRSSKKDPKPFLSLFSGWKTLAYIATAMVFIAGSIVVSLSGEINVNARPSNSGEQPARRQLSAMSNPAGSVRHSDSQSPVKSVGNPLGHAMASGAGTVEQSTEPKEVMPKNRDKLGTIAKANFGGSDPGLLRQVQALSPNILNPDHIETRGTLLLPVAAQLTAISTKR